MWFGMQIRKGKKGNQRNEGKKGVGGKGERIKLGEHQTYSNSFKLEEGRLRWEKKKKMVLKREMGAHFCEYALESVDTLYHTLLVGKLEGM